MDIKIYNKFILFGSKYVKINNQVEKIIENGCLKNNDYIVKMIINPPSKYNDLLDLLNNSEYVVFVYNKFTQDNLYYEIVKKYDYNLKYFHSKLNESQVNDIICYLIYIQIELFDNYGFVWHKLSLSNIFVENNILIQKIYISDLENSCILDPKYGFVAYYNQNNLLINGDSTNLVMKIYKTFIICISLLADKKIMNDFLEKTKELKQTCYYKSNILFNVYKTNLLDNNAYEIYKYDLFIMINQIIQECWNIYNNLSKKSD